MRLPITCGIACLVFLCSCATQEPVRPVLPTETAILKDPDRIYLTLHLNDGKELLFVMDTGAPDTILDKSLEPILGKRVRRTKVDYQYLGEKPTLNVYAAPKLYLGNTQLLTAKRVITDDMSRMDGSRHVMGILGMDCLRHYCIQLDFANCKIRFLDPDRLENETSGEKFPLTLGFFDCHPSIRANLFGQSNARWVIDTGAPADVALAPKQLRELKEKTSSQPDVFRYSKLVTLHFSPKINYNDEIYTNFVWCGSLKKNTIGCRFLSRYLTTLDFPKHTMFLEHNSAGSPVDGDGISNFLGNSYPLYTFASEVAKFLSHLKEKGEMPGWSKGEKGNMGLDHQTNYLAGYPISETVVVTKNGDVSKYHYTVVQPAKDGVLKLQKAWRTDAKGHIVEEYQVP